jgi:hypothetical protein
LIDDLSRPTDHPTKGVNALMMIALRVIHILGGVFWAGAAFFAALFLLPSMHDAGPAAGPVMRQLIGVRRYPTVVSIIAGFTVLSGLGMYWYNGSHSNGAWYKSVPAMTYGLGGLAAILTMGVAGGILTPTAKKLGQVGGAIAAAGGPPSGEQTKTMAALQARMAMGTRLAAALLHITVLTMSVARYL